MNAYVDLSAAARKKKTLTIILQVLVCACVSVRVCVEGMRKRYSEHD